MDQLGEFAEYSAGVEPRLGTCKTKFKTILVGVDFSGPVQTVLNAAKSVANQFEGSLVLVHAVAPVLYGPGATPELFEADLAISRAKMEVLVSKAALESIPYRSVIQFAEPTDLIDNTARALSADLVVVGSDGARGLEKLAFGSVAESVLQRVACPVLVIGPHCRENSEPIRSIVFATNLKADAFRAAQYASSISEEMRARLTLLHVRKAGAGGQESPRTDDDVQLLQALRQLLPGDAEQWCHPTLRVETGSASEQVLRVADAEGANLILVGVRDKSSLAGHSPRSTLSRIIRGAECPVLAVRGHLVEQPMCDFSSGLHR